MDHSAISFLDDGTPCESLVFDEEVEVVDAVRWGDAVYVAELNEIKEF